MNCKIKKPHLPYVTPFKVVVLFMALDNLIDKKLTPTKCLRQYDHHLIHEFVL